MMFGLKREIEEKTSDYNQRRADQFAAERKRAADREAAVRSEADKAAPERLRKFRDADRKAHAQWRFACKVTGGFIVLRWSQGGKNFTHGLNLSAVTDISMSAGSPVLTKGTGLVYNEYSWDYGGSGYGWNSYWTNDVHECLWPADAISASITLAGPGFVIKNIPHRKADAAYEAIMSAIEASPSLSLSDNAKPTKETEE